MRLHAAFRRPSKRTVFFMLMAASVFMMLSPEEMFRPARNLAQTLAPPQLAARTAAHGVTGAIDSLADRSVSAERQADLTRLSQGLENENLVLRQQVAELESKVAALAGVRQRGLSERIRLVPARVVGHDASPGRDSQIVSKGRLHGVRVGRGVVSHVMVDAGAEDGVPGRSPVLDLARESLIGWVDETFPFTSRVALLTDRVADRPLRVHIAPSEQQHRLLAEDGKPIAFVLQGAGSGRMIVPDVPTRLVDSGGIRVGDLITSAPDDPQLPLPMVIGRITAIEPNLDEPLHANAIVEPLYAPTDLREVYIVDRVESD